MGRFTSPHPLKVIMVEMFLRTMLGTAGYRLLELYVEHAVPINLIIFGYLGMIFLGRRSFRAMKDALKNEIEKISTKSPLSKPEDWFAKILKNPSINWENVSSSTKTPFFSPDNYWWFGLKNGKSMAKHFSPKRVASWYNPKPESKNPLDKISASTK